MRTRTLVVVSLLALLAAGSLAWAGLKAWRDSADLRRRAEEIALFRARIDPYTDPDMTYPPSAAVIFTPVVGPFGPATLKLLWLGLNLAALAAVIALALRLWARDWPVEARVVFALTVAASKPVRLGIGLGQFHLIPLALMMAALARPSSRAGGLGLGVALAKPTMVAPFLVDMALRRSRGPLVLALAFQALAWAVASAWLGIGPLRLLREWVERARGQEAAGLIDVPSVVSALWPEARALAPAWMVLTLVAGVALIVAARDGPGPARFGLSCFVAALFTYHRPYDLVLLVPAMALVFDRAVRSGKAFDLALAGLSAAMFIAPVPGRFEGYYNAAQITWSYGLFVLVVRTALAGGGCEDPSFRAGGRSPEPAVGG